MPIATVTISCVNMRNVKKNHKTPQPTRRSALNGSSTATDVDLEGPGNRAKSLNCIRKTGKPSEEHDKTPSVMFPGTYPLRTAVWAKCLDKYQLAEILDLAWAPVGRDGKHDSASRDNKHSSDGKAKSSKSDNKPPVQYYVHFQGFSKRFDRWVHQNDIEKVSKRTLACLEQVEVLQDPDEGNQSDTDKHHVQPTWDLQRVNEHSKRWAKVICGEFEFDAWYHAKCYGLGKGVTSNTIYFCPVCLEYHADTYSFAYHKPLCSVCHPPGFEILKGQTKLKRFTKIGDPERYELTEYSVFVVDGSKNSQFALNLCQLGKLFLEDKKLEIDQTTFHYFVLVEWNATTGKAHVAGYFSRESDFGHSNCNNLACLMVLPPFQHCGYGNLLIDLSYALSTKAGIKGSPERPLSDLGKATYRKWWGRELLKSVKQMYETKGHGDVSIMQLSDRTHIQPSDVSETLLWLGLLQQITDRAAPVWALHEQKIKAAEKKLGPRRGPEIEYGQINNVAIEWCQGMPGETSSSGPSPPPHKKSKSQREFSGMS